jgi:taurine dioxygenase
MHEAQVRLNEPFGVEVDIDLASIDAVDSTLPLLFAQHGLLVFREQSISREQQRALMACLGPVLEGGWALDGYVSNVREDGLLANHALSFHSDFIFTPKPLLGISLYAIEVDDDQTSTYFASNRRALDILPPGVRRDLVGRDAVHFAPSSSQSLEGLRGGSSDPDSECAIHPVLMKDPITAQEVLYVTRMNTAAIVGLEKEASTGLLDQLDQYPYSDDNIYQHHWRNGDVVIWSNIGFQHARDALKPGRPRTLQRVIISDATSAEEYQESYRPDRQGSPQPSR